VSSYFHRDDPGLLNARQESAWDSFLKALAEFTPEIIDGLKGAPVKAFREVANEYKKISSYEFGSALCQSDGRPILNPRPLGDLALLICSLDGKVQWTNWPPSSPFREPAMQKSVSKLSDVMREWAAHFLTFRGNPHFGLVNAALHTMHQWLVKPESMASTERLEHAKIFTRRSIPISQYEIQIDGWNPRLETEKQFNARFKRRVNELNRFVKGHVREMKRQLAKPDVKRNPAHYQWVAFRLARRMTYPEITKLCAAGNPESLDDATIRKGVKVALQFLGLQDVTTPRHLAV
jgi:hypothetical protein